MPDIRSLIRELAQHAIAKKGAQQEPNWHDVDPLDSPHLEVPGPSWTTFFDVYQRRYKHFARMPVFRDASESHRNAFPVIQESNWLERDGHIYMEVPLEADLPIEFLKSLIDDAYAIVWNKLTVTDRLLVELAGLPYDERMLIDRLIEMHNVKERRTQILYLARHAILLRTKKSPEAKIPLGATKIGGRPDLPTDVEWPTYRTGKSLAFLAQIDLAGIDRTGAPIKGLPADGLLSVFSVYGWMEEGHYDPHLPDCRTQADKEQIGWSVILHTPPGAMLERRKTPRDVNSFKAASVELTPILSLPNHRAESPLFADWTDEEFERFDSMQMDYRSLQMGHWLKNSDAFASHHLLGGYALFQQEFPEEIAEKGLAMLLQIGSDSNTEMSWGDAGELTFCVDAKALSKSRFEHPWVTYQCG